MAARPGLVDRALRAVGLQRADARPLTRPRAAWDGAQGGRLMGSWNTATLSANQEVEIGLRTLRARARDLARNNPWVAGVVREIATQVLGPEGIRLVPQIRTRAGGLAKATNVELSRAWAEWSLPEHASADGIDAWVDLQRLAVETIAVDGECFVRQVRGADNAFGYALQLLDADLVDDTFTRRAAPGRREVRMGVEVDGFGKPVAYHVFDRHPSEPGAKRLPEPIPASEILHLFIRRRPGQVRGLTWFAPVVADLHMLDGYEWSAVVAARAAAAKMGFIVNKSPEAIAEYESEVERRREAGEDVDLQRMDATPGVIDELNPGQEFQAFDPAYPSTAYGEFVSAILRGIARGLGVSYMTLTGDLSSANYSSLREGRIREVDTWRTLQGWLVRRLHQPVYRSWLSYALLTPALRVDSRLAADYTDVSWKPRGWQWVDPAKDATANERKLKLGLTSRTRLAAEEGLDYEEIVDELRAEQEYADAENVDVDGIDARASDAAAMAAAPRPSGASGGADAPAPDDAEASTLTRLRAIR